MKFCSKCGKEIVDDAVFCPSCGSAVGETVQQPQKNLTDLLNTLVQRINTNAIIWIVIGALQILGGLFFSYFLAIVGALNIFSSISDLNYSKTLHQNPTGIVEKFEPLIGPIITLGYNLIFGGVIGAVGSIYYLLAIRSFVLENREKFTNIGVAANPTEVKNEN